MRGWRWPGSWPATPAAPGSPTPLICECLAALVIYTAIAAVPARLLAPTTNHPQLAYE
jgi:hypothetical protein